MQLCVQTGVNTRCAWDKVPDLPRVTCRAQHELPLWVGVPVHKGSALPLPDLPFNPLGGQIL